MAKVWLKYVQGGARQMDGFKNSIKRKIFKNNIYISYSLACEVEFRQF